MLASPLQLFSASAGSGKTYTLTLEYIKLSLHEVEPRGYFRRILAVTFTIKAAEEMRTRIIKALSGISAYPDFVDMAEKEISESNQLLHRIQEDLAKEGIELTLDELATRAYITLQQILQDYGLFSVMTIDAFVQRLSSSFVEELHLPSQFEVILDINSLMNDLMDQLLDKVNQSGDPVLTDLILSFARQEVIDGRNWNRIRQSLIDFLKISFDENYFGIKQEMEVFSMSDFLKIEHQINTKIDSIENQIVEISQEIVNLADSLHKEESYFANGVKGPINAFRKFANGQSLKIDKYSSIRNAIDQNKWHASKVDPITKTQIEGISNQLTDLATEFIQLYEEEISKYLLFKLIVKDLKKIALISSINEEYQVYQHEQSSISIAEFARRINEIISQDPVPFIYEKLGDRYFHILIDEFQDTSILQWKNFMPLLENTVSLGKRNLLVGDAKQSIYKFRGGEVGLIASLTAQNPQLLGDKFNQSEFDQVRLDYLMNQIQLNQLESNYRSAPEIVEFNNAFFSWISNQPTYQGFCALLEPVYGHRMTQIPQVSSSVLSGQVDMLVFQKPVITAENKELEAKWMLKNVIQLIEYNVTAGFRLGDIALLTRKNKDAKFLALQLKEAGYPIISADSLLVYYSSLVAFILALLKMKVDPQKPILLFEAAYALADIHGQVISLEALNFLQKESTFNSIQSMVLNQYVLEFYSIQMESLWEDESLLDSVYHTIAIFDLFSRAEGSEYVLKLLDIVQDFTLKNASSISDFLAYFDLNKHSFSISCPENVDAITITSIHKSKGLEYPVVILPFASWTHQASDRDKIWFKLDLQEEEFVLEEKGALPYFYARANANDLDQFEQLASQKQQEKDAIFLDALNMLYVACTRAKQHLHILFSEPNLESHFKTKSTFEQSIGKLLLEYLQTCKTESEELPSFMDLEFEDISKYYVLSKSTSFIQKQRSIDSEIHLSLKLDAKTSAKPLLRVRSEQADLYTLAKEKRERGEVIHKQLENLKSYEDINQDEVLPEILELLEMDEIKQFFKPGELFISEEDILLPNGNMIRPDRVIKQHQTLIVVDYKTGKKKDSHQSQVNSYCEALRQMGYLEVKGAIIYTMDKAVEYV